jgi:hypothetical protein
MKKATCQKDIAARATGYTHRLFGAKFSTTMAQLCRRLAFLGPGFLLPRFRFVVDLPFWGQVFCRQGSGLSSTCLFGARFSAAKVQVYRRLAFLEPSFRPPRLSFMVDLPFWGQVFAKTQLCCLLAFLEPGERPPRLRFIVGL